MNFYTCDEVAQHVAEGILRSLVIDSELGYISNYNLSLAVNLKVQLRVNLIVC